MNIHKPTMNFCTLTNFLSCKRSDSPYINHFLQSDTIVPSPASPQSWNRYSYVRNNPLRYTDPTGHKEVEGCGDDGKSHCVETDPTKIADNARKLKTLQRKSEESQCRNGNSIYCFGIQGLQIQVTISAGLPTDIKNMKGQNLDPLFFYGLSFVFDKHGGFQVYGLTRDLQFDPYYNPGPADNANEMSYAGAGISLAGGIIRGSEFAARGTSAYAGRSVDTTVGYGPISVDHYELFDENSGTTDGTKVSGDDIGRSWGTIVSGGSFAVNAHPWFPRIGPTIQDPWAE